MPTYEYTCSKCGHDFDYVQPMKDSALTVCPKDRCARKTWGKGKVKRLIGGGAGLIFKGSGFYITDYRSEGYKTAAKNDAAASKPAATETKATGGDTKSDAPASTPKPAPAADSGAKAKKPPP